MRNDHLQLQKEWKEEMAKNVMKPL